MYTLTRSLHSLTLSLFLVFQGGAEEAKAFVEELLQWKAEAMMSRVDDAKEDAP